MKLAADDIAIVPPPGADAGTKPRVKVVHMSSHHQPVDNRIFYRECRTLADSGFDVHLVIRNPADEVRDGVKLLAVKAPDGRLERVTRTAGSVFRRALETESVIYHFHDPELIPWGILLRMMGKRVVFDVHEDFGQAAGVREWIPSALRPAVAGSYRAMSRLANRLFDVVIAERYYEESFPGATPVLNYPHLERSARLQSVDRKIVRPDRIRLLYAGSASESRGALLQAELAKVLPGSLVHFSGNILPPLVPRILETVGPDVSVGLMAADGSVSWAQQSTLPEDKASTVMLQGVGYYVTTQMVEAFCEPWTAGLALFPYSTHYYEKELTKFFEYMAAGLPLIVSDFPNWRAIVDRAKCGFAVDYRNTDEAAEKIRWLHANPDEVIAMGERGRAAMIEEYNWKSQQANLVGLYRRILAEEGVAGAGNG